MCRDGSPTGIGVRLQPGAKDLMIYLEGGGACFNAETCDSTPLAFGDVEFSQFAGQRGGSGVFSTTSSNPVGDWNMVYVPYCTGDIHGGSRPDATIDGVSQAQQFVGHANVENALALLKPYLGDPDHVLLTGSSAGGFGTLINFPAVADAFTGSSLTLLDDSGPIFFDDLVLSPPLAATLASTFNLSGSLPADASALFATDGLQGVYGYLSSRYPDATFGLSSYLNDAVIRYFFGFGQPDGSITAEEYASALRDVRGRLPASWGTYYADGIFHTFLASPDRFGGTSAGTAYTAWLSGLLAGTPTNVDPAAQTRVPLAAR